MVGVGSWSWEVGKNEEQEGGLMKSEYGTGTCTSTRHTAPASALEFEFEFDFAYLLFICFRCMVHVAC